jgi:4-amino-4-deoxy-L-arabinose transferase-like glycosyltransferase
MFERLVDKPAPMRAAEWGALLATLGGAAWLYVAGNDFPLWHHYDEPKKVGFVLTHTQDFYHPVLMLQVARLANLVFSLEDPAAVAQLCRTLAAAFGVAAVAATFLLGRAILGTGSSLAAAAAMALTPIVAIHAHYFKEDVFLLPFCVLALVAVIRFVERDTVGRAARLGVCLGLAASTKYIGGLLLVLPLVVPLLRPLGWGGYIRRLTGVGGIAAVTFASVNYPAFADRWALRAGVAYEFEHGMSGHEGIVVTPLSHLFGFHLTHSILPGMAWALGALGLLGLCLTFVTWRNADWRLRLIAVYTLLFYVIVEITPLKPYPGYMRYVLPVVPTLAILATVAIAHVKAAFGRVMPPLAANAIFAVALGAAAVISVLRIQLLSPDTRAIAADRLCSLPGTVLREELYVRGCGREIPRIGRARPGDIPKDTKYIAVSSFWYERVLDAVSSPGQTAETHEAHRRYQVLFQQPFEEIGSAYGSLAFSNPTIRIVDVSRLADPGDFLSR